MTKHMTDRVKWMAMNHLSENYDSYRGMTQKKIAEVLTKKLGLGFVFTKYHVQGLASALGKPLRSHDKLPAAKMPERVPESTVNGSRELFDAREPVHEAPIRESISPTASRYAGLSAAPIFDPRSSLAVSSQRHQEVVDRLSRIERQLAVLIEAWGSLDSWNEYNEPATRESDGRATKEFDGRNDG